MVAICTTLNTWTEAFGLFSTQSHLWTFQMSQCNYVFEFSSYNNISYTRNMQLKVRFHLPLSKLRSDWYSLSCCGKPAIFNWFSAYFHSESMNIYPIAICTMGAERAPKTAHFTYTSSRNMYRPQILNSNGLCINRKIELRSYFNLAKNPQVNIRSMYQPGTR